ncbi:MAG: class I SAM-dependent methyltransferase [Chloroflexota bacterium]
MQNRALREREQYNTGLKRSRYVEILKHCKAFSGAEEIIRREMCSASSQKALCFGAKTWRLWLEWNQIYPDSVHAINVSERELKQGEDISKQTEIKPVFHLMDAHKLDFNDNEFDLVFGSAMLHHLDLHVALREIQRVLKPNGKIVFYEPLGINPVSKVVRLFTPEARTDDEQPFRMKELAILNEYFNVNLHSFQLLSVPVGVVSGLIFNNPENFLTYGASTVDRALLRIIPSSKYLYRDVLIVGQHKQPS